MAFSGIGNPARTPRCRSDAQAITLLIHSPAMTRLEDRRPLVVFALFCLAALALAGCGSVLTRQSRHYYLIWNLTLAVIPLVCALGIDVLARHGKERLAVALGIPWLLFLPNAPYILTDFIHLQRSPTPWAWGHLLLLVWFSFAGLAAGIFALHIVHRCVTERLGPALGWAFVAGMSVLSGIGVALGRFQRWNSWDILHQPQGIAQDLMRHFPPARLSPETILPWGLGAFFGFAYLLFWSLRPRQETQAR
jgi:uncharacterized membrane protein